MKYDVRIEKLSAQLTASVTESPPMRYRSISTQREQESTTYIKQL
jgi:hypothetical protein